MQDEYWKDQSEASRKRYIEHLKKLMPLIKDERYPALKSQIKQIESELGINIVPLDGETKTISKGQG